MEAEPLGKDYKEMLSTHFLEKDYLKLDRLCVCGPKIKCQSLPVSVRRFSFFHFVLMKCFRRKAI